MMQGARRAVYGFIAITTVLGVLPAEASSLSPLPQVASLSRQARVEVAQIVPITVMPYRWMARKTSDGSIVLSGYEPDSETKGNLLAAAGAQALDASSIASGAPAGFASDAETALALLALFEEGTADLAGSEWTVTGRASEAESAKAVNALIDRQELAAKGWVLNITVGQEESTASNGPDSKGEEGDSQQVAGAGSGSAIETLPSESADNSDSVAILTADDAPADASLSADPIADDAPVAASDGSGGTLAAATEAVPAPAPVFSFAARKQGSAWLLGGDAPIDAFQRLVDIHLGITSSGRLAVVPAPEGFGSSALKALDVLATLENGRVLFDGRSWTLDGVAASKDIADAAEKAASDEGFEATISVSASGFSDVDKGEVTELASSSEAPVEAAAPKAPVDETPDLPVAEPYAWQAELSSDGKIDFSGYVPDADVRDYLEDKRQGGNNLVALADGAPDGFSGNVLAGLDALAQLSSGKVDFDGTHWYLTGVAGDAAAAELARTALARRAASWMVDISAPAPSGEAAAAEPDTADTGTDEALREPGKTDMAAEMPASADTKAGDMGVEASPPARADFADLGLSTEPPQPKAPPPPPLPTVTPFVWQAQLQPDGALDFSGYVPAETLKRYLDVRSNGGNNDTALAAGAPEGFAGAVLAGLEALSELDSGRLDFDGGNWSLTGAAENDGAKSQALAALGPFAENWIVAIATPEPPPAPPARPTPPPAVEKGDPDYVFVAEKTADDGIELSGDVPAAATRAYLGVIAGTSDTDALTVRQGAPGEFIADAVGGLRALMTLDTGKLVYKDFGWSLSGKSASDTTRAAVAAAVGSLPGGENWSVDVVPPTPLEICVAEVSAFDERNAILFNAGSSRITDDSLPAIDEIAQTLKTCPSAVVHVEGHTDSDGDADSNLILSVARAEAVVDKLISLGVGESRIYAIGYGESLPIASNDTRDGKRRNRRIVITVSDDAN